MVRAARRREDRTGNDEFVRGVCGKADAECGSAARKLTDEHAEAQVRREHDAALVT